MKCSVCGSEKDVFNNSVTFIPICIKCAEKSTDKREQGLAIIAKTLRENRKK